MTSPHLEVETESAGRYDDVDLETLHRLVSQLTPENSYLILHRSDRPDEFAQAAIQRDRGAKLMKGSFIVEFKDELREQYQAKTGDVDRVAAALEGWAFDVAGWKDDLRWKRLKLNKVINFRGGCTVSESGGAWTAHFPTLEITATGSTEEEARAELRTVVLETANRDAGKREIFAKWCARNLVEVSPEELERIDDRKLSPEQEQRINESFAESLASRPPKRKRR